MTNLLPFLLIKRASECMPGAKGRFCRTSPLTLLRSLEPAWEPGWDPPWELGWELGVLELEELPLLVLCRGLSTMGSVLLRSGLLREHKREGWCWMVLMHLWGFRPFPR